MFSVREHFESVDCLIVLLLSYYCLIVLLLYNSLIIALFMTIAHLL